MNNYPTKKVRWVQCDGDWFSVPEDTYADIMHCNPIKIAYYLIDSNPIIRKLAKLKLKGKAEVKYDTNDYDDDKSLRI